MQQVDDFIAESEALHAILTPLDPGDYDRKTQFKSWTVNNVLQHLHIFNVLADYALRQPERFATEYGAMEASMRAGETMIGVTDRMLAGLSGPELLEAYVEQVHAMATPFAAADPKTRVKWAGPDMSVRSSVTARQMETWAHAQEVWDLLGLVREDTDRIRNIAHLGVQTYGWSFVNRGAVVPEPAPYVRLTAPSGAIWEWGERSDSDQIDGRAHEFCQVVTQTRNIADTDLSVTGHNAAHWMQIAQCFAGPPEDPPAPGSRGPG